MKVRVTVTLVAALALGVGSASAQSIGLYFDPSSATCSSAPTLFTPGTMYVLAVLSGADSGGITGAEFQIQNFPAWFPSANAHAGATTIGNPLTGGANIAFSPCDTGAGGLVVLYTNNYFITSAVSDVTVSILRHTNPSNPFFLCSLVTLCDAPAFTKVCVNGGQAFINPVGRTCTVGVQPATWSQVKGLYAQ